MEVISPVVKRWKRQTREDPEGFWARAVEQLPWVQKWDRVFDWQFPAFRWYLGGETNLAVNCLDSHVAAGIIR